MRHPVVGDRGEEGRSGWRLKGHEWGSRGIGEDHSSL